jgi:hypothetical protein
MGSTRALSVRAELVALSLLVAACGDRSGAPGASLRQIAYQPCGLGVVSFFAYQAKGGAWAQVSSQDGVFHFQAPDTVAIAFTSNSGGAAQNDLNVYYLTVNELEMYATLPCPTSSGVKFMNGSVSSVPAGNSVRVTFAAAATDVDPATSTAFQLFTGENGLADLVASSQSIVSGQVQANRVIVRRAQPLTNGVTIPTLDFATGGAWLPLTSATISLTGIAGATSFFESIATARGSVHRFVNAQVTSDGPRTIVVMPPALVASGDLYVMNLVATGSSSTRSIARYTADGGDQSLALGPALNTPAVTTLATGSPGRIRLTLAAQPEYPSFVYSQFLHTNSSGFSSRRTNILATAGWFGGTPATWTIDTPDLTGVTGFPAATTGIVIPSFLSSQVTAYQGSLARFFGAMREAGTTYAFATRTISGQQSGTAAGR